MSQIFNDLVIYLDRFEGKSIGVFPSLKAIPFKLSGIRVARLLVGAKRSVRNSFRPHRPASS